MNVTPENYEQKRRELIELNSNMLGIVLRESEEQADQLLARLKREYFEECGGKEKYDIPVLTDEKLRNSSLYRFCSRMPKGADLHVHDMALLPVRELVRLLADCPEFCINADRRSFDLITAPPEAPAPDGYLRFRDAINNTYSFDELLENWTVAGAKGSGVGIWQYFEGLFDKHAALSGNLSFAEKYYARAFRYYCEKNIQHIEIHIMLTESLDESADYIRMLRRVYYEVKKEYPWFTLRMIGAGVKADSRDIRMTKQCFLNTAYVQEIIKDESDPEHTENFVIGFDLVNEEDSSLPLHAFAPMLLTVKKQFPSMGLYIHGGESLEAGNENLIDAYLLGVSRVGHGLNLYRYPELHARYVKAEICLEVCPISNQCLGYACDIRNHPATEYLRTGMAMALCSDDPAYMENETLTDDFFAAVVGWDLGIADLKQLAVNSIMYSGLGRERKTCALRDFKRLWAQFIKDILSE